MDMPPGGWGDRIFSGVRMLLILSTKVKSNSASKSPRLMLMSVRGILPGLEEVWKRRKEEPLKSFSHWLGGNRKLS